MSEIYLHINGQQAGPYSVEQIRQYVAEGRITGETPAWHKDLSEWSTVAQVVGLIQPGIPPPPPTFVPPTASAAAGKKGMSGCVIAAIICGVIGILFIPCLAGIALGPITHGIQIAKENASMQYTRVIGLAMFAYANDHNNAYPTGKTSTEVFQKLIDEKYISDPAVFYVEMPGKTKATSNTLTAENVCYDVTADVTTDSPDGLPLVFLTGYTVSYQAGASATRAPGSDTPFVEGIAVAYKSNSARFIKADADGTVSNFIPATFDPGTKTYQQLKP